MDLIYQMYKIMNLMSIYIMIYEICHLKNHSKAYLYWNFKLKINKKWFLIGQIIYINNLLNNFIFFNKIKSIINIVSIIKIILINL